MGPHHIVLPPYKAKIAAKRPKAPATEAPTRTFSAAAEDDLAADELVAVPEPVETPPAAVPVAVPADVVTPADPVTVPAPVPVPVAAADVLVTVAADKQFFWHERYAALAEELPSPWEQELMQLMIGLTVPDGATMQAFKQAVSLGLQAARHEAWVD